MDITADNGLVIGAVITSSNKLRLVIAQRRYFIDTERRPPDRVIRSPTWVTGTRACRHLPERQLRAVQIHYGNAMAVRGNNPDVRRAPLPRRRWEYLCAGCGIPIFRDCVLLRRRYVLHRDCNIAVAYCPWSTRHKDRTACQPPARASRAPGDRLLTS